MAAKDHHRKMPYYTEDMHPHEMIVQLLRKDERIYELEKQLAPAIELIDEAQKQIRELEARNKELLKQK